MKQSIKDGKQENLPYTIPLHSNYLMFVHYNFFPKNEFFGEKIKILNRQYMWQVCPQSGNQG